MKQNLKSMFSKLELSWYDFYHFTLWLLFHDRKLIFSHFSLWLPLKLILNWEELNNWEIDFLRTYKLTRTYIACLRISLTNDISLACNVNSTLISCASAVFPVSPRLHLESPNTMLKLPDWWNVRPHFQSYWLYWVHWMQGTFARCRRNGSYIM